MTIPEGYVFQSDVARLNQARGKAEGVLRVLAARNITVTDEQRAHVLACRDLEQLDRWLIRAATATTATDVFEP